MMVRDLFFFFNFYTLMEKFKRGRKADDVGERSENF